VKTLFLHIILFYVLSLSFLFAERKDSVYKVFPEVKVEANKYSLAKEKVFSAYSVIDRKEIESENPLQISELLSKEPGIYIKNYGGSGGIKTLSLRGTSSSQSLILIEGMRFNSVQNSSLDFGVLPVSLLQSIDILHGGSSAIFGGSSIGGTINFNLVQSKKKLDVSFAASSFNEYCGSVSGGTQSGNSSFTFAAEYLNAKSDYPFTVRQFGKKKEYRRENADFENFNFMLNSKTYLDDWQLKTILLGRLSERGSPGPVLLAYLEPDDARLKEKEVSLIIKAEKKIDKDVFSSGLMCRHSYQSYYDSNSPNALRGDTISFFHTNAFQVNEQYSAQFNNLNIIYSIDAEFTDLRGDFLQPRTENYVSRLNTGLSIRCVTNAYDNGTLNLPIQIGGRYDIYSDIAGSPTGIAGMSIVLPELNLAIKSQAAYNYRAPSFNEMYYLNYGTADLYPERSTSLNMTLSYGDKIFDAEINTFLIDTKDQIVAVPKSPLTWSAQNMAAVLSRGVELVFSLALFARHIHIGGSYTIQSVIDNNSNSATYNSQVVYVPQEMLTAKFSANYSGYYFGINAEYNGFTYYLPENTYSSLLPAYCLLSINLSKTFSLGQTDIITKININNLLGERYTVIKNYPMPGRIIRLTLGLKLL